MNPIFPVFLWYFVALALVLPQLAMAAPSDQFLQAVSSDNIQLTKDSLAEGADINFKGMNGDFALQEAIDHGNNEMVKLLLERGADVNIKDDFGETALIAAAKNDRVEVIPALLAKGADVHADHDAALLAAVDHQQLEIIKQLLAAGADANAKNKDGQTILMHAIGGPAPVLQAILDAGAKLDVKSADNAGVTLLMYAAGSSKIDMVQLCLAKGANIKALDHDGNTALLNLPLNSFGEAPPKIAEMIKFLVDHGVDVNAKNHAGDTALLQSVHQHVTEAGGSLAHANVVQALLDAGADINAKNDAGDTTLHLILQAIPQNPEVFKLLIARGSNPNATNKNGQTPLMLAAEGSDIETIKLLLDKHADPNAADHDGNTALGVAVEGAREEIVKALLADPEVNFQHQPYKSSSDALAATQNSELMLAAKDGDADKVKTRLESGADVNGRDRHGRTPLMYVAQGNPNNREIASQLILRHADVSAKDDQGETAPMIAASNDRADLLKTFLQNGADPNARNKAGRTVLMAAVTSSFKCTYLLIERHLVDLNVADAAGQTALHLAAGASWPQQDILQLLVVHGAAVNAADKDGRTPLMLAAQAGNVEVVELLLSNHADRLARAKDRSTALSAAESARSRAGNSEDLNERLARVISLLKQPS